MKLSATTKWIGLALCGLAISAVVAIAASNLVSQQIGITSESVAAGDALAPAVESAVRQENTGAIGSRNAPESKQAPESTDAPATVTEPGNAPAPAAEPEATGAGSEDERTDEFEARLDEREDAQKDREDALEDALKDQEDAREDALKEREDNSGSGSDD
jgi:hypothetical protein